MGGNKATLLEHLREAEYITIQYCSDWSLKDRFLKQNRELIGTLTKEQNQ